MPPDREEQPLELGPLLHAAFRGLRMSWMEQLAPWDLTPHQWRALRGIASHDEGVRLGVVAEHLRIAPRSATEVVDQLESRGLVERTPDPKDRRAVIVQVTVDGARTHEAVWTERRERSDEYFRDLSPTEQEQLASLLSRLVQHD